MITMPNTTVRAPRADRATEPGAHSDRTARDTQRTIRLRDLLLPTQNSLLVLSGDRGEG